MPVSLFKHNQEAYEALVEMLDAAGKACVVHPTGTGKSFIAFKYCEDHPEQRVLWLSPSEYIFRTQCENLTATGVEVPGNISFMTYAKLALLEEREIGALCPDAVLCDEYHRTGAKTWQQGVKKLLRAYPDAGLIGLSATSVRYLDGKRDMSAELFDGCVAAEMTLGEAIARGILKAPRYVLTSFSLEAGLKNYQFRVSRARSAQVRDEGERLLEALRRALEKADGLDVVFQKHMTNHAGKYLVFCANIEHLKEMMSHAREWFGKIDPDAHIYYAYSDDPAASRAFRTFKADQSKHLKLLFSVDMLNEGIHVEDISGVILFRPTVSPIIYKQQIGRALSASVKSTEPVIFDVVNNIENLYSIGAVEQEMRDALFLLRDRGEREEIITDHFDVIDELLDSRELFSKLDETLRASWDLMFQCAKQYYLENGNLLVPRRYRTAEGYALGNWIISQRQIRAGRQYGKLDERRVALLDGIGMVWDDLRTVSWEQYYSALCNYKARHGDLDIKSDYIDETGVKLGMFIENLRTARRDGRRGAYLTQERVQQLDALGMIWDRLDYAWEQNYLACSKYFIAHGNLDIPRNYVQDGLRIGSWVRRQRMLRDKRVDGGITEERIQRLDDIGMIWTDAYTSRWNYGYEQAKLWYASHGSLDVPTTYVNENGFPLGAWLRRHIPNAQGKTGIIVTPEKREKLDALGMVWDRSEDPWEVRYALAKSYFEEHGTLNIPPKYQADGVWLAKWVNEQRQVYVGNRPGKQLTEDQIRRLEAIGISWKDRRQQLRNQTWQEQYEAAKQYYQEHGDLRVPGEYRTGSGKKLGAWIQKQRTAKDTGKLSKEQIELLTAVGMEWEAKDAWESGFSHAKEYFMEHGDLNIPHSWVCEDGYTLGVWIANQRSCHNRPRKYSSLSSEQTRRLEAIGMVWNPMEEQWLEGYRHAEAYLKQLHGAPYKTAYVAEDGHKTGEWIRRQERIFIKGTMNPDKLALFQKIGLFMEKQEQDGKGRQRASVQNQIKPVLEQRRQDRQNRQGEQTYAAL